MKLVALPDAPITCQNLIGGRHQPSRSGELRDLISPYTGTVIGKVPLSNADDVAAAVEAALPAAATWRATPVKERSQIVYRFRELVLEHLDRLSNMAALEAGKTVGEARAGLLKGLEVTEFALSLQNMDDGGILEVSRGVSCEVRREPLGVVAGITPFNFPAMVPMWMFPIAITVGNAFILKPSEKVPITACLYGDLMVEAGFPPGVFSLVHGARDAVESLIDHDAIQAVGFVGSTAVARAVYRRATGLGKRALALGGAKNPIILVPDANPEIAVPGVVASFTGCAGQRCMAAANLVTVGKVDHLVEPMVEHAGQMRLGPDMGAIIDRAALDRLHAAIDQAEKDGATIRLDGRKAPPPTGYQGGNWLGPTIIDHVTPEMECARAELFGPILTILRMDSLDDALAIDFGNCYGNATAVFTSRGATARYVAEHATAGMVGVNIGVPVPREPFSFGGHKDSRFGTGDITGKQGADFWSRLKKITIKWAEQPDTTWMS